MRSLLKYGISALALTVGISAANAQNMEEKRQPQGQSQEMQRPDAGSGQQEQNGQRQKRGEATEKRDTNDGQQGKSGDRKERTGQADDRKERASQAEDRKDGDRKERTGQSDDRQDNNKQRPENRAERRDDGKQGDQMQRDRNDGGNKAAQSEGGRKPKSVVKNVQITKEKKVVIRDRVINHAPKRYTRNEINFNLSIGTSVPRNYVIYDVPPTFIDIVPEYQGYDYIVVGDVLLIIDPDTREIVEVIDV